jgi:hypothetical protein
MNSEEFFIDSKDELLWTGLHLHEASTNFLLVSFLFIYPKNNVLLCDVDKFRELHFWEPELEE